MAYFAKLDENNIVKQVHSVSDDVAISEEAGITFLKELFGPQFNWKQTFIDDTRKNYAGIDYAFDAIRDAFIAPKPYESWILNEDKCQWNAPTAMPNDGKEYQWNEATTFWDETQGK
jgi:hypothetical protein